MYGTHDINGPELSVRCRHPVHLSRKGLLHKIVVVDLCWQSEGSASHGITRVVLILRQPSISINNSMKAYKITHQIHVIHVIAVVIVEPRIQHGTYCI